jgi:hypothetical protein
LFSTDSEVRKNGRMVSPDEVASRPMKAVKSITVTAVPLGVARGGAFQAKWTPVRVKKTRRNSKLKLRF